MFLKCLERIFSVFDCISTKILCQLCQVLSVSSDSILFPADERRSLGFATARCQALSNRQFTLLTEFIVRYLDALSS